MSGGFALPRIRVRSRRRKPRGPQWRRKAAWCCAWLVLIAANLLSANCWSAIGAAVFFVVDWRELHHAPCDPDAKPLTLRERERHLAMCACGLALMVAGNFV